LAKQKKVIPPVNGGTQRSIQPKELISEHPEKSAISR
jgi:hypothetical protein